MTTDIVVKQRTRDHKVLTGTYEPGNGTRYLAMAIQIWGRYSLGALGAITDGWLVINGNNGRAYLFQGNDQPLMDSYIKKHLGGHDSDYPHLGDLVRKLIGRPGATKKKHHSGHQDWPPGD